MSSNKPAGDAPRKDNTWSMRSVFKAVPKPQFNFLDIIRNEKSHFGCTVVDSCAGFYITGPLTQHGLTYAASYCWCLSVLEQCAAFPTIDPEQCSQMFIIVLSHRTQFTPVGLTLGVSSTVHLTQ